MTWDQMREKHAAELRLFNEQKTRDWTPDQDPDAFERKWSQRYNALLDRQMTESQTKMQQEAKDKADHKKVHDVIRESQEAAAWVDMQIKNPNTLRDTDEKTLKIINRLDQLEREADADVKHRIESELINKGVLPEKEDESKSRLRDQLKNLRRGGRSR